MHAFLRGDIRPPFTYAAALAFVGFGWVLSEAAPDLTSPYVPLQLLAVAVLASGVVGGHGPALLAAFAAVLTADYFFLLPAGTFKLPGTTPEIVAFAVFVAAAALTVWASSMKRRAVVERGRADTLSSRLAVENRHRQTLLELAARSLAGGSVDAICRDAASMTASALGVEHCVILELKRDDGPLVIASASGWDPGAVEGLSVEADADTQTGYALFAREPVVVHDADSEVRFKVPPILRAHGVRGGVAARIAGVRRPYGVVAACSTRPRPFSAEDTQFVSGVAAVLGATFERKRIETDYAELAARERTNRKAAELASRRAAFLSQTATVFDTALEPETTIVSLARLAVPTLGECAIVDLVQEDSAVRRVDVVDVDPSRRDTTALIKRQVPNLRA